MTQNRPKLGIYLLDQCAKKRGLMISTPTDLKEFMSLKRLHLVFVMIQFAILFKMLAISHSGKTS